MENFSRFGSYDQFRIAMHNNEGYCGYTKKFDIFKPIIAAVNGYAFAAGLESCLLADLRIASENAEFGVTERRWNIVAGDGLCVRLPLVVGYARAMELIITGKRIDAEEAYRFG
jgi:enoyl-CoA hydratase